eukprot:COSAG01_NODE_3392_length_6150_cov_6.923814_2_plen_79_part_00
MFWKQPPIWTGCAAVASQRRSEAAAILWMHGAQSFNKIMPNHAKNYSNNLLVPILGIHPTPRRHASNFLRFAQGRTIT